MAVRKPAFTEEALVELFLTNLQNLAVPLAPSSTLREFDYESGRTDVLCLSSDGEVVAFEAKLTDWRKALHQAWRNTSFANRVYVVLPSNRATIALQHLGEFEQRGVGLCFVDDLGIRVVVEGAASEPVIPWLHNKAKKSLLANDSGSDRGTGTQDLPEAQLHLCPAV